MAVGLLRALAALAPAPVLPLCGDGVRAAVRRLRIDSRLHVVASPRHATVLLVAGRLPVDLLGAAARVHDQLPDPRGVVLWSDDVSSALPFSDAVRVAPDADPGAAIADLHRALVRGERSSSPPLGPAECPVRWQGVGPHGQGGEGMMKGTPYGRPMAMTGEDVRDGLQLDRLPLTVGPFLPWLPPGLTLEVELQGDVIASLSTRLAPLHRRDVPEAFERALTETVPLAALERSRAQHLLGVTADLLVLHGLDALAERALRLADHPAAAGVRRLHRVLHRSGALRLGTAGVGVLGDAPDLTGQGSVARAAGRADDARIADPAYDGLGFEILLRRGGDAQARWRQRLDEAEQALILAGRAGDRLREPGPSLEGPRGRLDVPPTGALRRRLEAVAVGQAWDSLATTIVSLDLDVAALPDREEDA